LFITNLLVVIGTSLCRHSSAKPESSQANVRGLLIAAAPIRLLQFPVEALQLPPALLLRALLFDLGLARRVPSSSTGAGGGTFCCWR
jgi:hypothetical protein